MRFQYNDDAIDTTLYEQIPALLSAGDSSLKTWKLMSSHICIDPHMRMLMDSLHYKAFVKADFDGNGYPDIMVTIIDPEISREDWQPLNSGRNTFCIMDSGNGHSAIIPIGLWQSVNGEFPVYQEVCGRPSIIYYTVPDIWSSDSMWQNNIRADTLVFEFGEFVELNHGHRVHDIEEVALQCTMYLGTIDYVMVGKDFKKKVLGVADMDQIVSHAEYEKLTGLLNYIDFENLPDNHSYPINHMTQYDLTITYDKGKKKVIHDYGGLGTFGLKSVYMLLGQCQQRLDKLVEAERKCRMFYPYLEKGK